VWVQATNQAAVLREQLEPGVVGKPLLAQQTLVRVQAVVTLIRAAAVLVGIVAQYRAKALAAVRLRNLDYLSQRKPTQSPLALAVQVL
jgi:hypothetical protein